MEAQVRRTWYARVRAAGVYERDCPRTAPAFAYSAYSLARSSRDGLGDGHGLSPRPAPSAWLNAAELPGAPSTVRLPATLPSRFLRKPKNRLGQALPLSLCRCET